MAKKKENPRIIFDRINQVEGLNPSDLAIAIGDNLHLNVKDRIGWFRLVHPNGGIKTSTPVFMPEINAYAVSAEITDENGRILASGTGTASYHEHDEYGRHPIECAETKAIGRALAAAGFGNQFSGSDFEVPEPIDTGVPIGDPKPKETKPIEFDPAVFNTKVEAIEAKMTPSEAKGTMITYGPANGQTIGDIYKKDKDQEDRLQRIRKYAEATPDALPEVVAAAKVFIRAIENPLG